MLLSLARSAFYHSARLKSSRSKRLAETWVQLSSLRNFILTKHINVVIDVGANEGQFVTLLRRLGYAGKIVSFEPDPKCFAALRARHASDANWEGRCAALGDAEGEATFNVAATTALNSFLSSVSSSVKTEQIIVPVQRLDVSLTEILEGVASPVVLMKTDTQGFDLKVLRGASACLHRITAIFAEVSVIPIYDHAPLFSDSILEYQRAGFDLIDLFVVNRTNDGRILEYDGLFLNRDRILQSDEDKIVQNWARFARS